MAQYTTREHGNIVERSLVQELTRLQSFLECGELLPGQKNSLMTQLTFVLRLMDAWVTWKNGSLISQPLELYHVSIEIMIHVLHQQQQQQKFYEIVDLFVNYCLEQPI